MRKHLILPIALFTFFVANAQLTATEWYNSGINFKTAKNYKAAVDAFKKAIEKDTQYFDAWYELGWCQNELKDYSNAIVSLTRADQIKPGYAKVNFEIAYANEKKEHYYDAINYYRICTGLSASYAEAWYRKGWCENQVELYDSAYTSCTRAIQINDDYREAYDELGYATYKLKRNEESLAAYRKSVELDPEKSSGYFGIADVYKSNYQNCDSAIIYYLKAFEKNPTNVKGPYNAGWCYNDKGAYATGVIYLTKALEIDPQYNNARAEMGYSYLQLKKYDEALGQLIQVINNSPKDELCRYYAGLCYYYKNDQLKLKQIIEQLQAINSDTALKYADTLKKYVK